MKPEYFFPFAVFPMLWVMILNLYRQLAEARVLRALHRDHHEIWRSLGSPNGSLWRAPGRIPFPWNIWTFRWAWLKTDPDWLKLTPELIEDFEDARSLFRRTLWPALPVMAAGIIVVVIAFRLLPAH